LQYWSENSDLTDVSCKVYNTHTDMRRLTTGIRSEKCVFRRFRRSANMVQCTYTNVDTVV